MDLVSKPMSRVFKNRVLLCPFHDIVQYSNPPSKEVVWVAQTCTLSSIHIKALYIVILMELVDRVLRLSSGAS